MERDFTRLGSDLGALEAAWKDRLADAEVLLASGRNAWAVATAILALEIRLKVLVCKRFDLKQLPKFCETHDLDGLLLVAGLSRRMQNKRFRKVRPHWDAIAEQARRLNELRYAADKLTKAQAETIFFHLKHPSEGVLPWLAKQ